MTYTLRRPCRAQLPRRRRSGGHLRRPGAQLRLGFAAALALAIGLSACTDSDPLVRNDQWTFVNYWAEWCKPCIKEIPELNALDTRDGYRVLGVNFDGETGAELDAQVAKLKVAFPTLAFDPAERYDLAAPAVLPTTLVIAPGGTLHTVLVGPQTTETLIAATENEPHEQQSPGPGVD